MNRIARTAAQLAIATAVATATLTLSTTAAHAEGPSTPGQIALAPHTDPTGPVITNPKHNPPLPTPPTPKDSEDPKPQVDGPGDITNPPHCTHGCGGSEVPDDKDGPNNEPGDQPTDEPTDDPAHDAPLDQGCTTGCDLPEDVPAAGTDDGFATPSRVDAGLNAVQAPSITADQSADLGTAYFVGLGLFSIAGALGVALAARKVVEKRASRA